MLQSVLTALRPRHWAELARAFRNRRYEYTDSDDLLVSYATLRRVYEVTAPDGLGTVQVPNLITTEGANYLLSCGVGGGAQYTTFYLAPFSGNITVADTLTAATFASSTTELTTQYSEGARVAFVESIPAARATTNHASPAVVTAAVDNVNIWGVGLLSSAPKGATTGILLSVAKYPTVRNLAATGDTLGIKYSLSLTLP